MTVLNSNAGMPGRLAPAFLFSLAVAALPLSTVCAQAPAQPSVVPPQSALPVPDQLELSKLIWSTMLAVDQANKSGNYSVLRDMASQGFQINNDPARLAQIFAGLRNSRVDLSNALLVPPTYFEPPRQLQADVFQVRGIFQLRPSAMQFDMVFQWEQGRWKLFGVDIRPLEMVQAMPGPAVTPPTRPVSPPPRRR